MAIRFYTAVFWGRGVVKGTNISEIPSASIFRVEYELADSSTEVFTVPYFTPRPSIYVTCTSDFFPFTHCSDKLPLFSTAQTDSPPPFASSQEQTVKVKHERDSTFSNMLLQQNKRKMGKAVMKETARLPFRTCSYLIPCSHC
jgi:hypothetical protein